MVIDVIAGDARITFIVVGMLVIAIFGVVEVRVIEVQTPGLFMVGRRSVHVGQTGHGAERQIQGAEPRCQDPTHRGILCCAGAERQPLSVSGPSGCPCAGHTGLLRSLVRRPDQKGNMIGARITVMIPTSTESGTPIRT